MCTQATANVFTPAVPVYVTQCRLFTAATRMVQSPLSPKACYSYKVQHSSIHHCCRLRNHSHMHHVCDCFHPSKQTKHRAYVEAVYTQKREQIMKSEGLETGHTESQRQHLLMGKGVRAMLCGPFCALMCRLPVAQTHTRTLMHTEVRAADNIHNIMCCTLPWLGSTVCCALVCGAASGYIHVSP